MSAVMIRRYTRAFMNILRILSLLVVAPLAVAGCATLDRDAVARTERLGDPPFVRHYEPGPDPGTALVLAPVALDRTSIRDVLVPSQAEDFAALTQAMDERIAAMACCSLTPNPLSDDGAPLVYVGSALGQTAPPHGQALVSDFEAYPPMILYMEKAAEHWRSRLQAQPAASAYLWIRLALVNYPPADDGLLGRKVVLGEGHEEPQAFLRTELQPPQVLQVTGVLLAPDGRVLAAGAEGIHVVDTPLRTQLFNLHKEIDPEQIEAILSLRREDLPGKPLKWAAALDNLVLRLFHPH
jgi:hypothetical protein